MPLLAIIDEAAFNALAEETVLGKDSFKKDEKTGKYAFLMDGAEAGKLAVPLQNENAKLKDNNAKLLDEKIKTAAKYQPWEKLGKTPEEIETILKEGVTADTEKLTKEHNAKIEGLKAETQRLLDAAKLEAEEARNGKAEIEKHLIGEIKRVTIAELKNDFGIANGGEDYFANRIDVVFDEDLKKYVPRVIENGEVAYKGTAFKTPKQLAEETRENKEFANLFIAGNAAGGGADPRQSRAGIGGQFLVSREASKTNPDLYRQAKEQAEKAGGQVGWTD